MSYKNLRLLLGSIVLLFLKFFSSAIAANEVGVNKYIPYADVFKNLDSKYELINGSMQGDSFFLHYCLPNFVPRGLGNCKRGMAPGEDLYGIQVQYDYGLNRKCPDYALLESAAYIYPFPVNVNLEAKTPYVLHYKKMADLTKMQGRSLIENKSKSKNIYEGLVCYESVNMPRNWCLWIPQNLTEYKTKLGNPPMFSCLSPVCTIRLDQGNGWIVRAQFNEAALADWRNFYKQLNCSIKEIME